MAKVIPIGQPVNDAERSAIAYLRDRLPDSYTLLHNFEIERQGERFEIDIALLTPHALYLIDVKGTRGTIDVYGNKWYPEGRAPYPSPLGKLRGHARTVKGLVTQAHPGRNELNDIYVDAAILLTAPDAHLIDREQLDSDRVVKLKDAERYFKDATRIPARFSKNILQQQGLILHALKVVKPASAVQRFGHWEVKEKLGAAQAYSEFRAENAFAGGTARLRVYQADPYQPEDVRKAQVNRIANAYRALSKLPLHPNIVAARDFFPSDDDRSFILILDDAPGQALTVHMARPQLALTLDQKWRVAKDLLAALAHAHQHGVVHRNLTPGAILIGQDGTTRITDFDFAKPGENRSLSIAADIVDLVEKAYVSPEAFREPGAASSASDIFSAGVIIYELFTGERPFAGEPTTVWDRVGEFLNKPSTLRPELNDAFDVWLQSLCAFDEHKRPPAPNALAALNALLQPAALQVAVPVEVSDFEPNQVSDDQADYLNLPAGYRLTRKFIIEKKLGRGSFGVVYKVIDTLGDVARTVKLIVSDRHSTLDRLKQEYRHLVHIPEHPHVVRVLDADVIPGRDIPFLVFEYVEGSDVGDMIQERLLSPEDVLELGKQVIEGLVHLHANGFHHCDIKPRNLLWTQKGAKIIDFNVSVRADDKESRGGGSRRYLPPDFDPEVIPYNGERADRDLYAMGLTLYEALTSRYPWDTTEPPINKPAPDPRELSGFSDLAPELVSVVLKAIAPRRAERFATATDFRGALAEVRHARRIQAVSLATMAAGSSQGVLAKSAPNSNAFVSHLLTLYSQSHRSNAGTRGMDALGFSAYVDTALDRVLLPAVLSGEFRLVLISGNAGDGKTAFLQRLEKEVEVLGGSANRGLPNGSELALGGKRYLINYDGSQDEGNKDNNQVLLDFLSPFKGSDARTWTPKETRLIAINEGRLVDFLATHEQDFSELTALVRRAFSSGETESGVAVVNLNLRSVVADAEGGSILERTMQSIVQPKNWSACESCDLKNSCYALHNARSFQDEIAGPRLLERLKTLYTMAHLRGRLHITMRDLRSALSFMLIGNRDCGEIHALYMAGKHDEVARSYYFNSWMGGGQPTSDRLLTLLGELDVGKQEDPRFDRGLDFVQPDDRALFRFERRGQFDFEVLKRLFGDLPRGWADVSVRQRARKHREYVTMARRKHFFERRDASWEKMLPYRSAKRMVEIVRGETSIDALISEILHAINRGEGLQRPERLGTSLALQLRQVEHGTVRSYRLFPAEGFGLQVQDFAANARFVEHLPTGVLLKFQGQGFGAISSELIINLDVFEMLVRLNEGYRPSVEEMQGFYLCLGVFKNSLNAQPYREILLTTTGHDFYRLARHDDGRVEMRLLQGAATSEHKAEALAQGFRGN
ncbi:MULTISPECIES: methylation-associated defense system protein kinase MAD6 [unclassified Pseudomonas]|uniref:methylation-associated defense system protein kinase MAD6 n=1 Tax=unclassified Pseudomonas TaxID=196821 RepID=UPI001B323E51|nr:MULTISPECIES: protein kinase [unclassified Pseudomonas]MBP5946376.1 protein kinase [Pseudomonas sp. P9(2020)]MBZ9564515.1 protein kinase [Pseudomonas sp. P116]